MGEQSVETSERYKKRSLKEKMSIAEKAKWHFKALSLGMVRLVSPNRLTYRYPMDRPVLSPNYRGMIVLLNDVCIGCSLCARVCPAAAMKMFNAEPKKLRPVISYERCIFCGYCVDICPVEALYHTNVHDLVFKDRDSMLFKLDKFTQEPPEPEHVRKIRIEIDEEKGLRYVPVNE